jgi:hypothetical protein
MPASSLTKDELRSMKEHVSSHAMSLAIIRTELSPLQLGPLLRKIGKACGLSPLRVISTPTEDFGFAELGSRERHLVVLWVGGKRTELVGVSETDESAVKELEDSVHSSNFHSEIIRQGT